MTDLHRPRQAHQTVTLLYLFAHLLGHHQQRGDGIADEQQSEQHAQDTHLPCGVLVLADVVQRVCVVCLEHVADEQERQQEAESTPHPRVKALDGDVHVVSFAERLQAVQDTLLIAELQILHHAFVVRVCDEYHINVCMRTT